MSDESPATAGPSRTAAGTPTLVIVSGPPGSGKTTLARHLAQMLGCPLISRDEITEGIHHTFGHDPSRAGKEEVTQLAFDTFFATIDLLLASSVSIVADAAFQDRRWRIGLDRLTPTPDLRLVHCTVDPDLATRRVHGRRESTPDTPGARRAATARQGRQPSPAGAFQPLSLRVPSITVATTEGYDPPLAEIVDFLRAARM